MSDERSAKYDRGAATYSARYANVAPIAARQRWIVASWAKVPAGASVLELGCADGFVTEVLVRSGYRVTGVDFSPKMLEVAGRRLDHAGLDAELVVGDINTFTPPRRYDVVLALMRSFYAYADEPADVLRRLGEHTDVAIADVNPRDRPLGEALAAMRAAGFEHVRWRALFDPSVHGAGNATRAAFHAAERVPGVRGVILKRKFLVAVMGAR